MESRFLNLKGQRKLGLQNRVVRGIGCKITGFNLGEGNDFWVQLSGVSKNRISFGNRVLILKCLIYLTVFQVLTVTF